MTRNGIFYNLMESHYIFKDTYIWYYFSSSLHLKKFKDRQHNHRLMVEETLEKRFGFEIHNNLLSDLILYKNLESRGFLIFNAQKGGYYTCPAEVILDGGSLI